MKLKMILIAALIAMPFAGCSDDDDDKTPSAQPDTGVADTGSATDSGSDTESKADSGSEDSATDSGTSSDGAADATDDATDAASSD